jgi:tetrahydromethanopterin S-methyltransferase subunit A
VAVCTVGSQIKGIKGAAISGPCMTENLGIEKIIANIVSNCHIRVLVVCGAEVKGHCSGQSLISLWENGIEIGGKNEGKIIGAKGAIPYIQNLEPEAIKRFKAQICLLIDLLGCEDLEKINKRIAGVEHTGQPFHQPPMIISRLRGGN